MKSTILFLCYLISLNSWSQEETTPALAELDKIQKVTPAEFEEIHRAFELTHHTLQCELANDILATLPYAKEEDFDSQINIKIKNLEKLTQVSSQYQEKLISEQIRVLKKLKRAASRKTEIQQVLTSLCILGEAAVTNTAKRTGYVANIINETLKLPAGFLLNFTRSSISGKEITDKRVLLRSYAGKNIEQSIAVYGLQKAYKILKTAGNTAYLPLLIAPVVDYVVLNLCEDLNTLNPEEVLFCKKYVKVKEFYQRISRSGSKLGVKFNDAITKDKTSTKPELPIPEVLNDETFCESLVNFRQSSAYKMRKKSMVKDTLKALLASEELAKPERFDFTTSQDQLEKFDITNLPEMKNVVISLDFSEAIKDLDSSIAELERVAVLEKQIQAFQKKLKKIRKADTIAACNIKKSELNFDYDEYAKLNKELEGSRLRKAALESSIVNKQVNQAQSFWRFFNRAKLDWIIINTNSIHVLREIIERKDILNVFIVTHSEGNLGKLLDSELNQIPTTFFKNISPTILSLTFYTCHSQNVMKNYDLENILKNSKSIHARRTLNFVQSGEFLNANDLAPIMGVKDYLQKVDKAILRSLRGSLLQQTLLEYPKAQTDKMCRVELDGLKVEDGTLGIQVNQNLVLTSDKNLRVSSDTFPCRLLKAAGENVVVIYNLNLIQKLKFNHTELTKIKVDGKELILKHFFDRKTGEYQSSKATF